MLQNLKALILLLLLIQTLTFTQAYTFEGGVSLLAWPSCHPGRSNTGFSLDGNHEGNVYLHWRHRGSFQRWRILPGPGDDDFVWLKNKATGRYLDSNHAGEVYTHDFNGGKFQKWVHRQDGTQHSFKNVATGRMLDCHKGKVYTWPPNSERSQGWDIEP